ncbi:MAG: hypothetical protein B6242_04650 [Anaerolineaceae bacterium 4572_78]|nr:MAG: hypothetical protein B6242_04650 [Anaerolineaceae bacterium 4572_78]
MSKELIHYFTQSTVAVLEMELGLEATSGDVVSLSSKCSMSDVTVLVSLVGEVQGVVMYSMGMDTALRIVSELMFEEFEEFDELAQSGISEMGNIFSGQGVQLMEEAGFQTKISPPTLVQGPQASISTVGFGRYLVPICTDYGEIQIHLAVRQD